MTMQADLKRRIRDRMARTGESYLTARRHILDRAPDGADAGRDPVDLGSALHLTNGDATDLAGTGLTREVVHWRDVLHEGPVPHVKTEELRGIRARFLAEAGADDRGEGEEMFRQRDHALTAHRAGEFVLWFEADLYDQLQIIQILTRLADLGVAADRIALICIGEHAGIARFGGLGQLTPDQLRALPSTEAMERLRPATLELAGRAWAAFCSPSPDGLPAMAVTRSSQLRFLSEAVDRLCREYPSTRDGLSLAERRLLAAAADGAADAGTTFARAAARESRPYLGDTWAFAMMERMAAGDVPLLELSTGPGPTTAGTPVRLTPAGARVLAGEADHVELNGIDRWIGGVHLAGRDVAWRWDEGTEGLISATGWSRKLG